MLKTYHSGFYKSDLISDTRACKFSKTGASFLQSDKKNTPVR